MKKKVIVQCKSLGIPLREDVARKVDQLVSTLPQEQRMLRRKADVPDSELVTGEKADISMVSTESVDRQGDVVIARGMDRSMFEKNPVVMYAHNYDDVVIGRCAWIVPVQNGLKAKTIYSDATEKARSVWACVKEGILKGKSIGFLALNERLATKDECAKHPEWKSAVKIIDQSLLLEYSVAPIPVNQDALVLAVAKGMGDALRQLGFKVQKKLTPGERAAIIAEQLKAYGAKLTPEYILEKLKEQYRA